VDRHPVVEGGRGEEKRNKPTDHREVEFPGEKEALAALKPRGRKNTGLFHLSRVEVSVYKREKEKVERDEQGCLLFSRGGKKKL